MGVLVETPRVNANEDQLQVIDIRVENNQRIETGDTILVVESTKAAIEVNAPQSGTIGKLRAKVGDFVDVGSVLCEIIDGNASAGGANPGVVGNSVRDVAITAKARKIAADLGVDLASVDPTNGRIGETEVRATANRKTTIAVGSPIAKLSPLPPASTRRAVIIGGGGHAACLIDALQGAGYEIIGCTDEKLAIGHAVCGGISVIGSESQLERLRAEGTTYAFVGIGGVQSNATRRMMFELASALGFILPPVIHPSATISNGTTIGHGCHILAGATIGPRCTIGDNVIINQGSILCHDSSVGDHAHLTPGAIVAGGVSVGSMSVIGMGATVLLGIRIGANSLIHNGAHVSTNVADNTIVDSHGHRQLSKSTTP